MNMDTNRLKAEFENDEGFAVPINSFPARGGIETELEMLKAQVLHRLICEKPETVFRIPLQRAVGDASALAWLTPYPLLLFPVLAEEKAESAVRRIRRQHEIRRRSEALVYAAV